MHYGDENSALSVERLVHYDSRHEKTDDKNNKSTEMFHTSGFTEAGFHCKRNPVLLYDQKNCGCERFDGSRRSPGSKTPATTAEPVAGLCEAGLRILKNYAPLSLAGNIVNRF